MTLKRPRNPMPDFVDAALEREGGGARLMPRGLLISAMII